MESLLKKAYLTGSEYAGASRPEWDFELWGVDDPNLYRSNFRPAEGVELLRDQVVQAAATFRDRIIRACTPLASSELSDFLAVVSRRRADRLSMPGADHLRYLLLYVGSYSITIPSGLNRFLPQLGQAYSGVPLSETDVMTPSDAEADIQSLENEISAAIAATSGNPADTCYRLLLTTVDLAARAFQLGLQNDEARNFFTFDATGLERRLTEAVDRINSLVQPGDPRLEMPNGFRVVFSNWSLPQSFYRTALARSDAMLTNIAEQIEKRQIDRAIFISGGFHSDYVATQLAHRHSIGCVIITPTVDKLDQERAYRRRLREDLQSQPIGSEPLNSGWQSILPTVFMVLTRAQGAMVRMCTGYYRRIVLKRVRNFVIRGLQLDGTEALLELECYNSEILGPLSTRVRNGVAMGVDQFDYFLGGNEINLLDPKSYVRRTVSLGHRPSLQILNMNPRFLYLKDASVDWVISLELDRIKRVADRRQTIREALRVLKSGGTLLLLAGTQCNEYARVLLRIGGVEVTRIDLLPFLFRTRFIAARKRSAPPSTRREFAWTLRRRFVVGKNVKGHEVWIRVPDTRTSA